MASRAVAEAAPRAAEPGRANRRVQTSLQISTPGDAAEREADSTARKVMSMSAPAIAPRERVSILAARAPSPRAPRTDETSPELAAAIRSQLGGGRPLPADTRSFMEPRFKADLSGVRIHTGAKAENLTTRLGARAFAYGRDIFFNAGQFQPDTPDGMELIAHELTHTIQQREVVQREVQVTERTGPKVQRGIVSEALDWIADKANNIPGYRLFTIVIGRNPINMERVERSGANILRALIEFIPGGHMIVEALENHGVIQKGGKFIEDQFAALGDLGAALRDALMEFIDSLGWRDIFRLGSLWGRAKRIFSVPVDKAIAFGKGLVSGIATLVKDAIIKPLGKWAANNIPKWDLLIGVFGKNPISDDKESPASALIGGFMKLIGQEEIWENIKKGNAVSKAWEWFQKAMKGALSLVLSIPGRVMDTIRSLTIFDIVTIVGAFGKIVKAFSSFVGDFLTWAGGTVLALLEIILSVVAPTMVPYLKKAGAAFNTIIKAPGRFINTLVQAGKAGFSKFVTNIVKHLTRGLLDWLLGSLAGANLYLPQSFTPRELLKFGLSVVGLTWTNVRGKLVAATNETVVKTLETGFDLVKTLVTEGPAAAWQQFLENLSNLKSMVQDAIMDYVKQQVIETAITRLLMMLNPAGAFIAAIQAIYKTVTFIVAKLRQIGALVAAFIDGLAAIAAGQIAPAAARVESVLANGLSLAISFLANYAGLGNISKKVIEIVNKIRAPVDKALDKVVAWVVGQAKKLGKMAQEGVATIFAWWKEKLGFTNEDGESHTLQFIGSGPNATFGIATSLKSIRAYLDSHPDKTSSDGKKKSNWATADKIFEDQSKVVFSFAKKNATDVEQRKGIADALAKISASFVKLSGSPPTDADYGANTAPAYGNPATVEISHTNPLSGSAARAWPATGVWKDIQDAGLTTIVDSWVQMHIIADKLGGAGDRDANLIPAPNSVNRGPFYGWENKTIELIKAKSGSTKNRVWVSVSVGGSKTAPSSINGKAGLYLWKGKKGKWMKMPTALLSASVGVPKPNLTGSRKFSLNFTSPKVMVKEFKISAQMAGLIYRGRPYKSKIDWAKRMIDSGATSGQIVAVESRGPSLNE
jgi:Domain of unknown function (DUF4157)/DNA/RNA non-specific endonuclease